jgi:hypothetical protein
MASSSQDKTLVLFNYDWDQAGFAAQAKTWPPPQ